MCVMNVLTRLEETREGRENELLGNGLWNIVWNCFYLIYDWNHTFIYRNIYQWVININNLSWDYDARNVYVY